MSLFVWRGLLLAVLVAVWQLGGDRTATGWISSPGLVATRLADLASGELWGHVAVTLAEMILGLAIGVPAGVLAGLILGRMPLTALLLRPLIVALYSVPLVTLAPLLILWFGLDMAPKIFLVAGVSFFLLFFNTFAGVQAVDGDQQTTLLLMGASRSEMFLKLVAPASMAWIFAGLKVALPYALIAAVVGEMMAARSGMGSLLTDAAAQIDMTGLYAVLIVLMILGVAVASAASQVEAHVLRWRQAER
ncbi:ABC transporter permease [Bosea caraganae]|nr:ABC transporter permease [Bosea caraganae]